MLALTQSNNLKRNATHLGKVAVHGKFRRGKKRCKRHQAESTTNFATLEPEPIVYKMKIPFLILCLAVVYGACRTYEHGKNDLTTAIRNNGDYTLAYANVPLERLLSRHSRGLLSPQNIIKQITAMVNLALKLFGFDDGIVATILSTMETTLDVIVETVFDLFKQFVTRVFLPGLHITLNTLNNTGMLPLQISNMIAGFNTVYRLLQFLNIVPR
ncbi:PREDICTED: uncharacterized protein LOC105564369 [Vollenhovia emeryi]|uniref:uncharacterized protein LOC105564369 n=1 Tax=Vollenhovia emeryi TaxID=411798 RepID=UPI0005F4B6A3|nr:PREDICTED: uncharacterized protein LOC105564369 [Vollenhovia emeryi]